jgi:cytochrome c-type biogenesis protein CcmH/NrfG
MAKPKTPQSKTYGQNTVVIVATICFLAGFMAGIIVSVVKTTTSMPQASLPSAPAPQQAIPADRSRELEALTKETAQNPDNVVAWIDLGNLYFDTNQPQKAIWAYEKSLDLQPNNANVWTDLGVMYRRAGQPQEAIKAFDEAIRIDAKHEPSRFNKGIVLLHDLNNSQGALEAWENLLKINPFAVAPNGQTVDELVTQFKKNIGQP